MAATDTVNAVGYCGLYCNACSIRQGKIKAAVNNLRDIIAAYQFDKIMPDLANYDPCFKQYDGFKQVMDGFVRVFGDCSGCVQGGGDPNCKVRSCAKLKGYRTCAECAEAKACRKLDPCRMYLEHGLQSIEKNGIKSYAGKMQKKVDQGYSYPVELNNPP
jgi:hypothetical protein